MSGRSSKSEGRRAKAEDGRRNPPLRLRDGGSRRACHRARVRATRWLKRNGFRLNRLGRGLSQPLPLAGEVGAKRRVGAFSTLGVSFAAPPPPVADAPHQRHLEERRPEAAYASPASGLSYAHILRRDLIADSVSCWMIRGRVRCLDLNLAWGGLATFGWKKGGQIARGAGGATGLVHSPAGRDARA